MNIEDGLPKIGAWQFTDLRKEGGGGGLTRKRAVVFLKGG